MYKYELKKLFVNCPKEWRHFIYHLRKSGRPVTRLQIQRTLNLYNAIKYDSTEKEPPYVLFEKEEDFLAFKLRFL